jgi:hypothetical protein
MWPFTFIAAPAGLTIGLAKWKQPISLVRVNRWRMILGLAVATAEIIGWIWVIVYLLTRPTPQVH